MAHFFTSPKDLLRWIKENNSSFQEASNKILTAMGSTKQEQDVIETTKRIFSNNNVDNASEVLFNILSQHNITEANIKESEKQYDNLVVSETLFKYKAITAEEKNKMQKTAQIMRQPGEYPMPLRVCPKLPMSVGQRLISTYNCRHYCLDGITFDDDPSRVYCAEYLWRRHVMDKFSREWQDPKTGEWVGGYINNRFYVFPDAGTPANPNVPRQHGNKMSLAPWERSRQARPHEWSVERRMQEQREPGSTKSLTLYNVVASVKNKITITADKKDDHNNIEEIFSKAIDMHNNGMSTEDAALKLSEEYNKPVEHVVAIQTMAIGKMSSHQADAYKFAQTTKPNLFTIPEGTNVKALLKNVTNGTVSPEEKERPGTLAAGTPIKPANEKYPNPNMDAFEVYNHNNLNDPMGVAFVAKGSLPVDKLQSWEELQEGAKDVGLTEEMSAKPATSTPSIETPAQEEGQVTQTEQK